MPSCLGLCLAGGSSLFPPFECCPVRLGAPKTRARNMAADTTISGLSLPVRRRFSKIFPKFFTKILLDISLIAPHLSTARCGIETVSTLIYSLSFVRGFIFFDKFFDKNSLKSGQSLSKSEDRQKESPFLSICVSFSVTRGRITEKLSAAILDFSNLDLISWIFCKTSESSGIFCEKMEEHIIWLH